MLAAGLRSRHRSRGRWRDLFLSGRVAVGMLTVARAFTNEWTTMHDAPTTELKPLLLTVEQVGELLGLSADGVRYLHRTHRLRGVVISRHLRFPRRAVERFVEELERER